MKTKLRHKNAGQIKRVSGRVLSFLIAALLLFGMLPLSLLTVYAVPQSVFTVELDPTIEGTISVTLTNSTDSTDTQTKSAVAGRAVFRNFVDTDNTYDIAITGMDKYLDYSGTGVFGSGLGISFSISDFTEKTFSITTTSDAHGTITATETGILYGSSRNIIATGTKSGNVSYVISEFKVDGVLISEATGLPSYAYPFNNIKNDHTVDVVFIPKTWEITFSFNDKGTVIGNAPHSLVGGKIIANEGDDPRFTATANLNYHVSQVKIDGDIQTDGTFDNVQTDYSRTFNSIDRNHSVSVTFSINTYNIAVNYNSNGSVTVGGAPVGVPVSVNHDEALTLIFTPNNGYDIEEVLLDGTPVTDYSVSDDGAAYTYTLSNIQAGHVISVTFGEVEVVAGDESDFYTLNTTSLMGGYPVTADGVRVYNFIRNGASATFMPKTPYNKIRINGVKSWGNASMSFAESILITKIEVYNPSKSFGKKWGEVPLSTPIQIIIDKSDPEVAAIPPMYWTNQNYTISGTASDENTPAKPSSGFDRVVWSTSPLTKTQVLSEATNTSSITANGAYSIPFSEEQNSTYYVYAVDKAQNVSAAKTVNIKIDKTNPKITGFTFKKPAPSPADQILNFLFFGTFSNYDIEATITAGDDGISSGLKEITLYCDGVAIETKQVSGNSATFKLTPDQFSENEISASVTDVARNNSGTPVKPSDVTTNAKSDTVSLKVEKPTITIELTSSPLHTDGDKNWYGGNVGFNISAATESVGLHSVTIKVNGQVITTDKNGKAINADFSELLTLQEDFLVNTDVNSVDGENVIEVVVVNNSGDENTASKTVYIDTTNPKVVGFRIEKENGDANPVITEYRFVPATSDGIEKTDAFIESLEYGFYFKAAFTALVGVADEEPSSGLDRISYRLVSYQNGVQTGETTGTQLITDGVAPISIPEGFKGQIFVEAYDRTANKSEEVTPQGFVVDNANPEIQITNNTSTDFTDADGNNLYVSDMTFTAVVSDYDSGLKEIGYVQSAEHGSHERKSIAIENTGYQVGDSLGDGWIVTEMDANLVTKATKTFTLSSDDNDVVLTLDAIDHSGNHEEGAQTEKVTIDKTNPIINIVFRDDNDDDVYYDQNRVADITVIERNFDAELIKVMIENTFGNVPAFSFSEVSNTEHTAVIDFDEGDYTFDVTGTDLGNHDATVNFSGGNEKLFYVDKTKPGLEENFIEFQTNNPAFSYENNIFNMDKTVHIKITEHHFDPALVNLVITRKDAGAEHSGNELTDVTEEILGISKWESTGDVHTIAFTFARDAVYQVSITPADLAGNTADNRSTVVFEIDKTVPVVSQKNGSWVSTDETEFLDIYPYARKDDPAPTVKFDDLNIDHIEYSLTVYIPDHSSPDAITVIRPVKVYLNEDKDKSGRISGSMFTLPDFVKDGVYALELTAVDVAGNKSLLNVNTYARMVEQDVLAYILESNLAAKTGLYSFQYENGQPISKRPDNFSDIKIFVLTKKDTGIDIILRNTNGEEVNTYADSMMDDSVYGYGIYNFTLESGFFKDNFQDDTDVELRLTVKNQGNRIDLGTMHLDNSGKVPHPCRILLAVDVHRRLCFLDCGSRACCHEVHEAQA